MKPDQDRALVLRGGTVIDGTGAPRFVADVRIEGERIAAVGAQLPTRDADVQDYLAFMRKWAPQESPRDSNASAT